MSTRLPKLPTWASGAGNNVQPTNSEITSGWPASQTPPSRQRFNWFFNLVHNAVAYLTRRGISDWANDEEYLTGDKCMGSNLKTYIAIQSNTNKNPVSEPTYWAPWALTQNDADNRYAALYGNPSIRFAVEDAVQLDEAVTLAQLANTTSDIRDDLTPLLVDGLSTINSTLVGYHYHPATGYTEIWGYMDSGGNTSDLYPITLDTVYHVSLTPIFNSTVSQAEAAVVQLKAFPTTTGISVVSSLEAESDDVFHADAGVKIMWKVTGKRISAP